MPDDARYELMLDQALRGLSQQQDALDNLRERSGTLVAASSLVSSFLGAATLRGSHPSSAALILVAFALLAFVGVVASITVIIWPYQWRWGIDPKKILSDYIEAPEPADLDELRRSLAWYLGEDAAKNQDQLDRLWFAMRVAVVSIGAQVVLWTAALEVR